ncbi:MAG TPA: triose-phosphate isomerase, partial [Roseiflexaceae bacterium]|nr:triose-phosphate isomerase [Roseiflexaceae bacterium]
MRTPLLAGNWKMYKTVSEATALVEALLRGLPDMSDREALVCPPFTALHAVGPLVRGTPLGIGGQDVFYEAQGAYTGAIS